MSLPSFSLPNLGGAIFSPLNPPFGDDDASRPPPLHSAPA